VCLGLLSKWIPETSTARTFEIPASGSFLLAERTPEHEQYFEEGREAEFFSTEAELVEKLRKYLSDSAARARIAAAGRLRCTRSGYSYEASMKGLLDELRQ
jgi:spore maturation protein CgeB